MGEMSRWDRIVVWFCWWVISILHWHTPDAQIDCWKCQRRAWLDIAKQYPPGSAEHINALSRAQKELAKEKEGEDGVDEGTKY